MLTILAFDTAGNACSAAIRRGSDTLARRFEAMERGHAEALMPMVMAVLAEAELRFDDLDAVAVTVGPGAFTGVRIGLAAARGMALAGGLPVVGVTNFEAAAATVPEAERAGRTLLVALETKRADLYVQPFDAALAPVGAPAAVMPEALAAFAPKGPLLIAGDAAGRAAAALDEPKRVAVSAAPGLPGAVAVAAIALRKLAAARSAGTALPRAEPLYLRAPSVTPQKGGGRIRP
jgi:tRNA threonylcarbamoyladenosine biosynthesis protein TsaB